LRLIKGTERRHVDAFHELEIETRQRHGIPAYPRRFFHYMWEELRKDDRIHLYLAYSDDRPVAGVVFLHFGQTAIYGYGASVNDRDVWRIGANQLTMWSAIREAYEKGMARVDFGPSRFNEPDLRTYKERWGGESRELGYAIGADGESHLQVNRTGTSVRAVSWLLQRLPQSVYATITPPLLRVVQ
jgi:lipid II:glycine glycyltransferase (peptidoglycan interpeptide bridge formation enzyme)